MSQYCGSLSMSGMKRKTVCIVRKGEKTNTNFRWLLNGYRLVENCLPCLPEYSMFSCHQRMIVLNLLRFNYIKNKNSCKIQRIQVCIIQYN
jgi:hypothetical protein